MAFSGQLCDITAADNGAPGTAHAPPGAAVTPGGPPAPPHPPSTPAPAYRTPLEMTYGTRADKHEFRPVTIYAYLPRSHLGTYWVPVETGARGQWGDDQLAITVKKHVFDMFHPMDASYCLTTIFSTLHVDKHLPSRIPFESPRRRLSGGHLGFSPM